jgi:hypothetical protein
LIGAVLLVIDESAKAVGVEISSFASFYAAFESHRRPFQAFNRASGALLLEPCRLSLGDQAQQVVRGATESEKPVDLFQSAQFYLT